MTPEQEEAAAEAVRQAIRFNRWYPAAHDAAVALWKAGTSGPAISAVMLDRFEIRKTKSAVIGRMFRAGLAFQGPRPHVDQAASARRNTGSGLPRKLMPPATLARVRERDAARDNVRRRKRRAERATAAPPKRGRDGINIFDLEVDTPRPVERIPQLPKAPKRKPVEGDSRVRESLRVPLWEIRDGMCKFIADDPLVDATMCGHQVVAPGVAWCPGHHAICCEGGRRRTAAAYRSWNPALMPIRRIA